MALDAKRRSSIFHKLIPLLGESDANALMSEFPASEADELVTKQFLRAELAELRTELFGEMGELRGEMGELRSELRGEMGELRSELRGEMGGLRSELRGEMGGLRSELRGEMGGLRSDMARLETKLTMRIGAALVAQTTVTVGLLSLLG